MDQDLISLCPLQKDSLSVELSAFSFNVTGRLV